MLQRGEEAMLGREGRVVWVNVGERVTQLKTLNPLGSV